MFGQETKFSTSDRLSNLKIRNSKNLIDASLTQITQKKKIISGISGDIYEKAFPCSWFPIDEILQFFSVTTKYGRNGRIANGEVFVHPTFY